MTKMIEFELPQEAMAVIASSRTRVIRREGVNQRSPSRNVSANVIVSGHRWRLHKLPSTIVSTKNGYGTGPAVLSTN